MIEKLLTVMQNNNSNKNNEILKNAKTYYIAIRALNNQSAKHWHCFTCKIKSTLHYLHLSISQLFYSYDLVRIEGFFVVLPLFLLLGQPSWICMSFVCIKRLKMRLLSLLTLSFIILIIFGRIKINILCKFCSEITERVYQMLRVSR